MLSEVKIIDKNGSIVNFQGTQGGAIDVSSVDFVDTDGFRIILAPGATEGVLYVKPFNSDSFTPFPFFKGKNDLLVKAVQKNASNTATLPYWIK